MGELWPGALDESDVERSEGELVRELAEGIGLVVMACAGLDHRVGELLAALDGRVDAVPQAWGLSGTRLIKRLREDGASEPEIQDLAVRYEDIYRRRNHIVHGLWHVDPDSGTDFLVGKPASLSRSSTESHEFWSSMPWDVRELKLLHQEASDLMDEIARLTVVYFSRG